MGCFHSKKKKNNEQKVRDEASNQRDQSGQVSLEEQELKTLQDILTAASSEEREVLLNAQQGELMQRLQKVVKKVVEERTEVLEQQFHKAVLEAKQEQLAKNKALQLAHEKEKKSLQAKYQRMEFQLLTEVERLTNNLNFCNEQPEQRQRVLESRLKSHLQVNIQTHGSPGEFWENELQNLLSIIERKNEVLREREQALMRMKNLVERRTNEQNRILRLNQKFQIHNNQRQMKKLYGMMKGTAKALEENKALTQKLPWEDNICELPTTSCRKKISSPPCH